MKFCYADESGTGDEPIAVLVGVIVDATRMHLSKDDWTDLLELLSKLTGKSVREFHTKDFYPGNKMWRKLKGSARSRIITAIFDWLGERKHKIVYSAIDKRTFERLRECGDLPDELNTVWRTLGFHLLLSVQRAHQSIAKNKGNTLFIFDNQERERLAFSDLASRPPAWSDSYYDRSTKVPQLNQLIDVPFFADSREVGLIQLADVSAYCLRRHLELAEGLRKPSYDDEAKKMEDWVSALSKRSIAKSHMYLSKGRCDAADLFYRLAPESTHAI